MTLNEYQKEALKTNYKDSDIDKSVTSLQFMSHVLGLVGESGEFADKIKKIYRNNRGKMNEHERYELLKELGDVLWHIPVLAHYLGSDFDSVAEANLKKLADRAKRGVINSKGDNR